ncbi:MAG: M23 family metallopeptidase [Aeromicrobium sp.]|uniref:M23 family metallopeptidase n=1 Tax=Aeromicrobium sp. TaxID=1871063 RepID=UPI0039E2F36F
MAVPVGLAVKAARAAKRAKGRHGTGKAVLVVVGGLVAALVAPLALVGVVVVGALQALGGEDCAPGGSAAAGLASGPGRVPIAGSWSVTSPYGMRVHPVTGVYKLHDGLDLVGPDLRIVATLPGTVASAQAESGYGNIVRIDHGGGLSSAYAHLSAFAVDAGQAVAAGQEVGTMGATGYATGVHLHFMVAVDGATVDPAAWLGLTGVAGTADEAAAAFECEAGTAAAQEVGDEVNQPCHRGTTIEDELQPPLVSVYRAVCHLWPDRTFIGYGDREGHRTGHSLDIMVGPGAEGDAIVAYLQRNAAAFTIDYIIWQQQIWSVARSSEGWRPMADRGSATANHRDHIDVNIAGD